MSTYTAASKRRGIEDEIKNIQSKLARGCDGNLKKILLDRLENAQKEYAEILKIN